LSDHDLDIRFFKILRMDIGRVHTRGLIRHGFVMLETDATIQSRLLLQASVYHMRNTLEALPVGTITINDKGLIRSIDASTIKLLNWNPESLLDRSVAFLFAEPAFDLLELTRTGTSGYIGKRHLLTRSGDELVVDLMLTESLEPHKRVFSVIYLADVS
jgi:PAS domain-containing protein